MVYNSTKRTSRSAADLVSGCLSELVHHTLYRRHAQWALATVPLDATSIGAPLPITSMSSTVCVLPACVFLASEDNVYVTVHSISLYLFMACKQYKLLLTFKYIMLFERLLVFLWCDSSVSLFVIIKA